MAKSYARVDRIGDLVLREVARFLQRETNDPRLREVSLTGVKVSRDKSKAKIYFTVFDKDTAPEVQKVLNKAAGFYRSLLAKSSMLRHTPVLDFEYDASILYGAELSQLIDGAVDEQRDQSDADETNTE
jgi:ribosome-binding factor A